MQCSKQLWRRTKINFNCSIFLHSSSDSKLRSCIISETDTYSAPIWMQNVPCSRFWIFEIFEHDFVGRRPTQGGRIREGVGLMFYMPTVSHAFCWAAEHTLYMCDTHFEFQLIISPRYFKDWTSYKTVDPTLCINIHRVSLFVTLRNDIFFFIIFSHSIFHTIWYNRGQSCI